jgi:hypothetical protein
VDKAVSVRELDAFPFRRGSPQKPPSPLKNSRHSRRFVGNLRKQWNPGLRNAGADSKPTLRGTLNALKRNGLSPFAG